MKIRVVLREQNEVVARRNFGDDRAAVSKLCVSKPLAPLSVKVQRGGEARSDEQQAESDQASDQITHVSRIA